MIDRKKLDPARQWAADVDAARQTLSQDTIDAAADLISSLPDQWVDAEKVRELITPHLESENSTPALWELVKNLRDLLPAPDLPEHVEISPDDDRAQPIKEEA